MLRFSALRHDGVDKFDHFLVYGMSLKYSFDHDIFRNLIGSCFDHDYFFSGRSDCERHIGRLFLRLSRVHNQFTVNHTDLGRRTWTVKRDIGYTGCNRGA